ELRRARPVLQWIPGKLRRLRHQRSLPAVGAGRLLLLRADLRLHGARSRPVLAAPGCWCEGVPRFGERGQRLQSPVSDVAGDAAAGTDGGDETAVRLLTEASDSLEEPTEDRRRS